MKQVISAQAISWQTWTLLAVAGGSLALGGSFYAGKWVGSSRPPTVIRMPPRLMPIPVGLDTEEVTMQQGEALPATEPALQSRPNRMKRIPLPGPVQKRSMTTDAQKSATDDT